MKAPSLMVKNKNWKFYYNDGKIWKEGVYQFDQKNGNWTTYFESGQKAMEGKLKTIKKMELGSLGTKMDN